MALAPVLLTLGFAISQVNCDQWERTDTAAWRAEGDAVVLTMDGGFIGLRRVDVTRHSAPDLWWSLEVFCRAELDGGL